MALGCRSCTSWFVDVIGVPSGPGKRGLYEKEAKFFRFTVLFISCCSFLLFCGPIPSPLAPHRPFVSPCLFSPRPHSLAPSLCAVMKISQAATHNGVPTSGAQTPQILPRAANPGGKPGSTHHPQTRPTCALHCGMLKANG